MRFLPLALIAILLGCTSSPSNTLLTKDGKKLAYRYHEGGYSGVILLHQLDGSKEDWASLEKQLEKEGYSYIAVDLRGHGQSDGDWTSFTELDFQDMLKDVEAAHRFLRTKGVGLRAIIGASIGANLALQYGVEAGVDRLVLLSPGFNYRGIDIQDIMGKYRGKMLVVASPGDEYSYRTALALERGNNATLVSMEGSRHGTALLPDINPRIMKFLKGHPV